MITSPVDQNSPATEDAETRVGSLERRVDSLERMAGAMLPLQVSWTGTYFHTRTVNQYIMLLVPFICTTVVVYK